MESEHFVGGNDTHGKAQSVKLGVRPFCSNDTQGKQSPQLCVFFIQNADANVGVYNRTA
jgi:hypothetical protein